METPRRGRCRRRSGALLGVALGLVSALGFLAVTAGVAGRLAIADDGPGTAVDATHLPPLLTVGGERVRLAYDLNCASDRPEGCTGKGTVYLRRGQSGAFTAYPLQFDAAATSGR